MPRIFSTKNTRIFIILRFLQ